MITEHFITQILVFCYSFCFVLYNMYVKITLFWSPGALSWFFNIAQFKYNKPELKISCGCCDVVSIMISEWHSNLKTVWCNESHKIGSPVWYQKNCYLSRFSVNYLKFQITSLPAEVKTGGNLVCFSVLSFYGWACLPSNWIFTPFSPPKVKDSAAAAVPTPAPGRTSSQVATGQSQGQTVASSHQLSVSPAHGSTGSSPHTMRRGKCHLFSVPLLGVCTTR